MRFHTQTAGVSLTAQQPEVNIVRTAIEALAAVLGGTQSLHTNSFDEALALPTEDAVRIALRTQQVIAHETGVVDAIDPLGGSYYVEALTNRLEREAYDYFDRIEKLGGVVEAIKENFFQREIAEASFRYQQEVERGERVVVGVNRYAARGRAAARDPQDRRRRSSASRSSACRRCAAGATRRPVEQRLAALKDAAARDGVEPDAADRRRRARLRDDGRDVRRVPRGLGRLARDARLLTVNRLTAALTERRLTGFARSLVYHGVMSQSHRRQALVLGSPAATSASCSSSAWACSAVGAAVATFAFFGNTGHSQETPLSNQPANIYRPEKTGEGRSRRPASSPASSSSRPSPGRSWPSRTTTCTRAAAGHDRASSG